MRIQNHPALELKGLGVSFGKRVVLDDINLSLSPDGIDVLMGPVKSGKSTMFRTLAGLYEGHTLHKSWGEVTIQREPVSRKNCARLVPQHSKTLDVSLLQALLEPVRNTEKRSSAEWRQAGLEWLAAYGLGDFAAQADQPLLHCDIRIQRSVQILAQALLKPPLLMIDEPTYGLNDHDAAWMVEWIKSLAPHCKLWVVLHNQIQARNLADRIVLIGGGRLLAHQDTGDFFQHPANEWVEQYIRTGGLSLPAPDAHAQDLADDVPAPRPLSKAAQMAIQSFAVSPAIEAQQETKALPEMERAASVHTSVVDLVERRSHAKDNREPYTGPERRKLADIPMSSRDGVELASTVGNIIFRDAGTPRGFNWIVPGKLAGCAAPGVSAPIDYDLNLIARAGITQLVTLTEEDLDQAALRRYQLKNIHLPIFDREAPSIKQTHMLLVRMQKLIESNEVLAVHCKAGLGRTGTILAAWLMREGGLTADDSMSRLRRIEPGFIQSKDQEDFLHRYEADLTLRLM